MEYELSEYINSITMTKVNLCRDDEEAAKAYPAFVVNRCMSYHQSMIFLSNTLNECYVPNLHHYEFLLYTTPVGKRFAKWAKPPKEDKVPLIARHYKVSQSRAREIIPLLTSEQLASIEEMYEEGGLVKGKGKKK